ARPHTPPARVAALVRDTRETAGHDPRLVEPLWRCLASPGVEEQPGCSKIVNRLLTVAMDADGLEELQKQEPYNRDFLSAEIRRRAYPFHSGLPEDSNLVTLLAWAEYLG